MNKTLVNDLMKRTMKKAAALSRPLISTYRLQFHKGFTFADATAIIPYLSSLGITHVYASPYLAAGAGSTHGYDVIDHTRLNPEVGSEEDYAAFCDALKAQGMSHILDTVPNHMGVDTNDNKWWNSVMELGRKSPYAKYFDIAWRGSPNPDLHDRLLIGTLGQPYSKALEAGELKVEKREDGKPVIKYFDRAFPISPETLHHVREEMSGEELDRLLRHQSYRLAWWQVATDEINYRRFFDINSLAALKMERKEVFRDAHAFTLKLLAEGKVSGLRVDHPDGLYDPKQYFHRLQRHYILAVAKEIAKSDVKFANIDWREFKKAIKPDAHPLYVSVEKILAIGEPLRDDWLCDGTSGYDFLIMVNSLFVNSANEEAFTRIYQNLTGQIESFEELVYQKKILVLKNSFANELRRLTVALAVLAEKDIRARDYTLQTLQHCLREMIACFTVYRTYIDSTDVTEADRTNLEVATNKAIKRNPQTLPDVFEFIRDLLLQHSPKNFTKKDKTRELRLVGKFQQLTSPATAKGVEDTAFYCYQRFISHNEVGGEPGRFGIKPDELHTYFSDRQNKWPRAMNALSTHDTKRSEDVRARLNVLSEIPDEWEKRVRKWMELNSRYVAPAPDEEYLIYQTLVGAWPIEGLSQQAEVFTKRIQLYMQKAIREAKLRTSWTRNNLEWEKRVETFIAKILDEKISGEFITDIQQFCESIARSGFNNSLSQTLIRLTAPGVPDTYQGTDLWDFSLVDPDNRRPVDYTLRQRMLNETESDEWKTGRVKQRVTQTVLKLRRDHPDLFMQGRYIPLQTTGPNADTVFAYARVLGEQALVCAVRRFTFASHDWRCPQLILPAEIASLDFIDLFTRNGVGIDAISSLSGLAEFPVTMFVSV